MGSLGANKSSSIVFSINSDRIDREIIDSRKVDMQKALDEVKKSLNDIMRYYPDDEVDMTYERLADVYPRHLEGDEAEKVILVDSKNERITTVEIRLWRDGSNKLQAELEPGNYSFDEFSDEELYRYGVERRR